MIQTTVDKIKQYSFSTKKSENTEKQLFAKEVIFTPEYGNQFISLLQSDHSLWLGNSG